MRANPPKPPMVACPHCGSRNEPDRKTCRNCLQEMSVRRICRTAEEAFRAGWDDGAEDPPLTDRQRTLIAALLAPHINPAAKAA